MPESTIRIGDFWSRSAQPWLERLQSTPEGLSSTEAARRLAENGANQLRPRQHAAALTLLLRQFKSPITLVLIFAAALSVFLRDSMDAGIILGIILISALLGFWQEHGAARALAGLLALVKTTSVVLRDGLETEVRLDEVVPGDVALLSAGAAVPADCRILEARDLFVNEAALTGETFPAEKRQGELPPETPLAQRINALFMGTHVVSGTARALVVNTGRQTEFGRVSERLRLRPPETDFERGIRQFGYLLLELTLLLVMGIFVVNIAQHRPVMEAFLFSLALAVGLTPQLLPAIVSVNLSHGAIRMARSGVIVRRLASIENFGSMDVLCTDKTGTLTEGVARVDAAIDPQGQACDKVLLYAFLNASFESGFVNPIDAAIRSHRQFDIGGYRKLDEIPYDFIRKRLSILVECGAERVLVTKGAADNVLAICSTAERADGTRVPIAEVRGAVERLLHDYGGRGFRSLGVACKPDAPLLLTKGDEVGMTLLGLLVLSDPPKAGIDETIRELGSLHVAMKMITGDNRFVAANISAQVGLTHQRVLTGADLRAISDDALIHQVDAVDVFAEVEPNQKERIILALRKAGHVVGYLGDGINDASALHAADVGISVDEAVDVAKEAADIVLLRHDLNVLVQGVREGRVTFANTLKYIFMATSANFGNMFSMAGASLFLPFLPLLPKQVLLTNLLTDFPEMTIATDNVDPELVEHPRRWNIQYIRNFMLVFGTLSSLFDYLTFAALWYWLGTERPQFRAGWFLESVVSATLIVLVVRSRRPLFRSRPSWPLAAMTVLVIVVSAAIPWSPLAEPLGFAPLRLSHLAAVAVIVAAYVMAAEVTKAVYFRVAKW